MTKAADVVVDTLVRAGVQKIFGVVGTSTLDLADAVARTPSVEFVSARSEEAAAHMADGYARAAGRVGVVLSHVGPGALRQMYGVGTAWKDGTPLLFLTGNEVLRSTTSDTAESYHALDVLRLYEPITKATFQLRDPADAEHLVARALWIAASGRPGAVLVDLPKDCAKAEIDGMLDERIPLTDAVPVTRPEPGRTEVTSAANRIDRAENPVVFVGGGARWSGAGRSLTRLIENRQLPLVTTDGGRGVVDEEHPGHMGVVARQAGDASAERLLAAADMVLVIGTPLSDVSTFEWTAWEQRCDVVRVDVSPAVVGLGMLAAQHIVADAREFVDALDIELGNLGYQCGTSLDEHRNRYTCDRRTRHDAPDSGGTQELVNPWALIAAVERLAPEDLVVSVDSGMHSYFGRKVSVRHTWSYLRSNGLGAMAYSLPAVLGALESAPDRRGIVLVGDGCLAMCLGELETAARRRSNAVVVVFNDEAFASQLNHQSRRFEGRSIGTKFLPVDFAAIAEAQGVRGWAVPKDGDFDAVLAGALERVGPSLVDARVDPCIIPEVWIEGSGDERTVR